MNTVQPAINIVHGTYGELVAFLFLNMWPSHFGLPLLLAIMLFTKRIKRHATFVNFCVAFIIVGLSSSLLYGLQHLTEVVSNGANIHFGSVYAGRTTGAEPSHMLCLLQASLLYGMPPLTSMCAFMLVLQMFLVIRAANNGEEYLDHEHCIARSWAMLIAPYIAFFIAVLATATIGAANPSRVSRSRRFFYCSVDWDSLTNTITISAAIILLATLAIEVWTIFILCRRSVALRGQDSVGKPLRSIDLSFPMRIMGFGMYIAIAMSLSLLSVKSPSSAVPDIVIATAATFFLLIFGTQLDILNTLCFWRTIPAPSTSLTKLAPNDDKIDIDKDLEKRPSVYMWLHSGAGGKF